MEIQKVSQEEKEKMFRQREEAKRFAESRERALQIRKAFLKDIIAVTKLEVEYLDLENQYNKLLIEKDNLNTELINRKLGGLQAGVEQEVKQNENQDTIKKEE